MITTASRNGSKSGLDSLIVQEALDKLSPGARGGAAPGPNGQIILTGQTWP
jgi:hypothetical protein